MSVSDALFVGIDTLRVLGPVTLGSGSAVQALHRPTRLDIRSGDKPAQGSEGNVTAMVTWRRGVAHLALEASLPKIDLGHNTYALAVDALRTTLERLHAVAYRGVRFRCAPEELSIMRLDVVRDFTEVVDGPLHLDGLGRVGAERAKTRLHAGTHGEVQTVARETTRWRAQLYLREAYVRDKFSERPDLPQLIDLNTGRLRYELQLKSTELRKEGITSVLDVTAPRIIDLARQRFHRCRFDFPIGDSLAAIGRVYRQLLAEKKSLVARGVLGQLLCDAVAAGDLDDGSVARKYRKLANEVGLHPSDLLPVLTGTRRRLDFERGLLVPVEG